MGTPGALCLAVQQSALITLPWMACTSFSVQGHVLTRQLFRLFLLSYHVKQLFFQHSFVLFLTLTASFLLLPDIPPGATA